MTFRVKFKAKKWSHEWTFNAKLYEIILEFKKRCMEEDDDVLILIIGDEGSGKSSIAHQIMSMWKEEKDFDFEKHVHIKFKTFRAAAIDEEAKKGDIFIIDEGYKMGAGINRGSKDTEGIIEFIMEARKLNRCYLYLTPDAHDLQRHLKFRRPVLWIRALKKDGKVTGLARVFNKDEIKKIERSHHAQLKTYPDNVGRLFRFDKSYGYVKKEDYEEYIKTKLREKYREEDRLREVKEKVQNLKRLQPVCKCGRQRFRKGKKGYTCRYSDCKAFFPFQIE